MAPLLLAFCALAVLALAVGPFLYRLLLPSAAAAVPVGCGFVAATGGLFLLLACGVVWQLRRRRGRRQPDLDRRLWEAALGEVEERRSADD